MNNNLFHIFVYLKIFRIRANFLFAIQLGTPKDQTIPVNCREQLKYLMREF